MPRLIVTEGTVLGLERCRRFVAEKNPAASDRARQAISRHFAILRNHPAVGRPFEPAIELRELVIPFGASGYVALYRHDTADDAVYVSAFRHQREAGYEAGTMGPL